MTRTKRDDEGRCPHGMFYSGAGSCPMCSETDSKRPRRAKPASDDEGRCPHGMFYSGAGSCPMCSA